MGLSLAGPSGVGLGLRALRWLACLDPVTNLTHKIMVPTRLRKVSAVGHSKTVAGWVTDMSTASKLLTGPKSFDASK